MRGLGPAAVLTMERSEGHLYNFVVLDIFVEGPLHHVICGSQFARFAPLKSIWAADQA